MQKEIKIILHGISQVFLQKNIYTGMIFLLGVFYNSVEMGFATIMGSIIGSYSAIILKYSKMDINNGLYGFNAVLVSIAMISFFGINIFSIAGIIFGSIFSTILMKNINGKIPAFTFPFILTTWIIILIAKYSNIVQFLDNSFRKVESIDFVSAISMGVGQVMFQGNIITGILFIIAIFISSRIGGFYALFSSIFAVFFSYFMGFSLVEINFGIVAYNGVLVGIALGNKNITSFILVILMVILSIYLNLYLSVLGLITLTFSFVLSTWLGLAFKKYYLK